MIFAAREQVGEDNLQGAIVFEFLPYRGVNQRWIYMDLPAGQNASC